MQEEEKEVEKMRESKIILNGNRILIGERACLEESSTYTNVPNHLNVGNGNNHNYYIIACFFMRLQHIIIMTVCGSCASLCVLGFCYFGNILYPLQKQHGSMSAKSFVCQSGLDVLPDTHGPRRRNPTDLDGPLPLAPPGG